MPRTPAPLALTAGLMKPLAAWIRNVNQRRMLADLPDHLLRDIGIRRDQIATLGDPAPAPTPAPAPARRPAEVVALAPARQSKKPTPPEKPMAA